MDGAGAAPADRRHGRPPRPRRLPAAASALCRRSCVRGAAGARVLGWEVCGGDGNPHPEAPHPHRRGGRHPPGGGRDAAAAALRRPPPPLAHPPLQRYDVIIDGSSIGSAGQHREFLDNPQATLAFGQIQAAIEAAAAQLGRTRPLVLLPYRFTQGLPPAAQAWLDGLAEAHLVYATPKTRKVDWSAAYAALLADIPYVTRDPQNDLKEQLKCSPAFGVWQATHCVGCQFPSGPPPVVRLLPAAAYTACAQAVEGGGGWMVPTAGPEWLQIRRCRT
eukprot:TRINITY_DN1784_c0_g1_i1.p2 TRINITY_DN1784_c0_g1~~TRINITY_DN1784_c0_g1_i1.p2  ORF type:complete len:319 (+),score=35.08 TRINITY_DN1784_c0_g1_i1:132-959(+)